MTRYSVIFRIGLPLYYCQAPYLKAVLRHHPDAQPVLQQTQNFQKPQRFRLQIGLVELPFLQPIVQTRLVAMPQDAVVMVDGSIADSL